MVKTIFVDGRGTIKVEDVPIHQAETDLLVKARCSLISPGTELSLIAQKRNKPDPEAALFPLGYCNCGDVISVGKKCKDFDEGDRVVCMGWTRAVHAEEISVPQNLCARIPENIGYREAVFSALAATSLHAVRRCRPKLGEKFLVAGQGLIGQFANQFLKLSGASVMAVGHRSFRMNIAKKLGVDVAIDTDEIEFSFSKMVEDFTSKRGLDGALICFGGSGTEIFEQIVKLMKTPPDQQKSGRIAVVGVTQITVNFNSASGNIDILSCSKSGAGYWDPQYEMGNDYPIGYVDWTSRRNIEEILYLLSKGRLDFEPFITHEFPIAEAPKAYHLLTDRKEDALGVLFSYS